MNCQEILNRLQAEASETYKSNVVRMGIPEEYSIGVSTATVRSLAKEIPKSKELAYELWHTGYHEARLLAVLLFDKKSFTLEEADSLMSDVISWDLCDHLCKNLVVKLKDYQSLIGQWVDASQTYKKRGAFTLMASSAIHDKKISDETLDDYLGLIREYSAAEQEHVKKAVSWALREIGKRDFTYNEKALLLAYELKESKDKSQLWIAKDAIKELENLVKVEGRSRLISASSRMGQNV
ncbi:MAG: DNA alkylation repair protein [Blautia sp.]|jgi:3-methyladenine DNA glycosylase AlkD